MTWNGFPFVFPVFSFVLHQENIGTLEWHQDIQSETQEVALRIDLSNIPSLGSQIDFSLYQVASKSTRSFTSLTRSQKQPVEMRFLLGSSKLGNSPNSPNSLNPFLTNDVVFCVRAVVFEVWTEGNGPTSNSQHPQTSASGVFGDAWILFRDPLKSRKKKGG